MSTIDNRFKLAAEDKDAAEYIGTPSLTYWQDCWRRLRKNKSAVLSMIVVIIIIISAIVIPVFWPFRYDSQVLMYANLPPVLDIYDLGDDNYIYITKEYKSINVDSEGHLLSTDDPDISKKNVKTVSYRILH